MQEKHHKTWNKMSGPIVPERSGLGLLPGYLDCSEKLIRLQEMNQTLWVLCKLSQRTEMYSYINAILFQIYGFINFVLALYSPSHSCCNPDQSNSFRSTFSVHTPHPIELYAE